MRSEDKETKRKEWEIKLVTLTKSSICAKVMASWSWCDASCRNFGAMVLHALQKDA